MVYLSEIKGLKLGIAEERNDERVTSLKETMFETPEVQRLLMHLKSGASIEFKPVLDTKSAMVHYPEVQEITGLDQRAARDLLEFMSDSDILTKEPSMTLYSCPFCSSNSLIPRLACPYCKMESLKAGKAIEHMQCGYVDFEESFITNKGFQCPKCGKALKALGVDYRRISNYYRCLHCGKLVSLPSQSFQCMSCGKRFPFEDSKLETFFSYRLNPAAMETIEKHTIDLSHVKDLADRYKLTAKFDVKIKGKSGLVHEVNIAMYQEGKSESEDRPDLIVDINVSKEQASEGIVASFITKAIDLGAQKAILVSVPGMSERARRLASYYGIVALQCAKVSDLPNQLLATLEELLGSTKRGEEVNIQAQKIDRSITKMRLSEPSDQIAVLLAMIYEKQADTYKLMKKILEQLENNEKSVKSLLQKVSGEREL